MTGHLILKNDLWYTYWTRAIECNALVLCIISSKIKSVGTCRESADINVNLIVFQTVGNRYYSIRSRIT